MARIFLSHSSANNAAAVALRDWLTEQGFDDVFLDIDPERGLVPGERWQEALRAAADRCEAVLFLVSPSWLASPWCLAEFLLARNLHKRIFGLIVETVALEKIPAEMTSEWQLCELTGPDRFRSFDVQIGSKRESVGFRELGLELLRRGLERAGLGAHSFPWPPPDEPYRTPYRGLRALEPQDAAVFFGRDAPIVRALDRIRGLVERDVERLLVVLGASGSGKSSFLRAGLWPRLARDDAAFLPLPVIRPETAAIGGGTGLAASLSAAFQRFGERRPPGRLKEVLAAGPQGFGSLLDELLARARQRLVGMADERRDPVIVLAVDQAEELFQADGAADAARFLEILASALVPAEGAPARRILAIATIRSDRFELLQSEPRLASVRRDLFDLPPMPASEFKSVIEGPAHRVGDAGSRLDVDPALTEQLIVDARGADALPLLAFTLERLYAEYGSAGQLTLGDYAKLGGVKGSIEAAVAAALAEPLRAPTIPAGKEEQLACIRAAFIPWLARIDAETGAPMRRLAAAAEIPERSRNIVDRLVTARLLVADQRAGTVVIEIAHESLLRQWPALATWLDADAADLMTAEGVERAAAEWDRNGRLEAWLGHRGDRLALADRLVEREDFRLRLGKTGSAYLVACRAREEAERREKAEALEREAARLAQMAEAQRRTARMQRMARWTLAAMIAAVVAGLGFGMWQQRSLDQRQAALDAAHIQVVAETASIERLRGNRMTALRLAVHTARLEADAVRTQAGAAGNGPELAAALFLCNWSLLLGDDGPVAGAQFSPDGTRILTYSNGTTVRVWNAADGSEIAVLRGHTLAVRFAAFSRDGSRIVTTSDDKTARVWNAADGKEIAVLKGHMDSVSSASFSPDGMRVVTASDDKTARIWDAADGREVAVLSGHSGFMRSASFSPDGARIVTASDDKTARVWSAVDGREILKLQGHTAAVLSATFSPDGTRIITASADRTARIWSASDGEGTPILLGLDAEVRSAAFSPDGTRAVTASDDKTARVWNAANGKELAVLRGHEDAVTNAAFSPDGASIVTASADRTARIWKAADGTEIAVLRGHGDAVRSATFSADGTRIVTASDDKSARVWNIGDVGEATVLVGHANAVRAASFSPDGKHVVTASGDKTARLWNAADGKEIAILAEHTAFLSSAAFSPDGTRIVTASGDKTAGIWNAADGKEIAILRGHGDAVRSAAFSPDGSRIVTASEDKTARIWNVADPNDVTILRGHTAAVLFAAFSPDGATVVTTSADSIARVWSVPDGKERAVLRAHVASVRSAAFSPDGTRIVTASSDWTARVWSVTDGNQIAVLIGHEGEVWSATFSPDGKRIVTASADTTARVWSAADGREIAVLRGHEGSVLTAAFSPDGTRIVTASGDKTARVWNAADGEEIAVLRGHLARVRSASFSSDGMRIVTASEDKTARVWNARIFTMPAPTLISEGCARLGSVSTLTRAEMRLEGFPDSTPAIDVCPHRAKGRNAGAPS